VRDVLVVLFWLWVLVAVGVYAYRIWRRVTQGPKSERQGSGAGDGSTRSGLGRLGRASPPPLPEGPVEARLPASLQNAPAAEAPTPAAGIEPERNVPGATAASSPRATSVAEAVQGIRMPDALVPVVDPTDPAVRDGRLARFSGTGTTVEAVTAELADELTRLGFSVDGLSTATPVRAGLSARRDGAAVSATVAYDDDSTAVVVELTTA
jgi:hypothetical protein